jgi:hypothetical protein
MPFSNSYNRSVANKVIGNARKDIEMKNKMYDDPASFVEPRSTQEYMSVQQPEIQGGSGNLAATSFDMGEEQKKVGGARINKARAARVAKALEGESKPMVITEQVAVKPKRKAKAKAMTAEGGDFNDIMDGIKKTASTVGDVVKTAATVAPYVLPLVGLGKAKKPMAHLSEWNELVKKVRAETGKSLKDTLKHIKENNLYKREGVTTKPEQQKPKKPRKTKEGGSSGGILINEVVRERVKGDVVAEPRQEGGVPSLKVAKQSPSVVPKARAKKMIMNK